MKFHAKSPDFRYSPMIVEGGKVQVMVYDRTDRLVSRLSVEPSAEGYLICGEDPGRSRAVRTKVESISAFDAARKYCEGTLL